MERTYTPQTFTTQSTKNTLPLCHQPKVKDNYNITNFYIPSLSLKKYNLLKLRELLSHKNSQKENVYFRKKLNLPYSNHNEKLLSKQTSFNSFKTHASTLHPSYSLLQVRNRRTLNFYNCKRKNVMINSSDTFMPFLTEGQFEKKYQEEQKYGQP